ncbi:putative reverse transcriptase zinc-binding domain-containing protein [Arabidopsis thaliana]
MDGGIRRRHKCVVLPLALYLKPKIPFDPPNKDSATLLVKDLIFPVSHQWDCEDIRRELLHHEEDILSLILSSTKRPDRLWWLPAKAGVYSTKSGYAMAKSNLVPCLEEGFNWKTNNWKVYTSPMIRMFLSKATKKALPIGTALSARGIVVETRCKRCGEIEDALHIFFRCPIAVKVWDLATLLPKPKAGSVVYVKKILEKGRTCLSLPPLGLGSTPLYPWILWFLWKARNFVIFEDRILSAEDTVQKSILEAKRWHNAKLQQTPTSPTLSLAVERGDSSEAHSEAFPCFSDAAWQATSKVGGMGWIIKDLHNVVLL